VTGGGSGIGRATALSFAREGAAVVVSGRTAGPLDETVKLIEAEVEGGRATAVPADITSSDDLARLVARAAETYGSLDIAVNNAGALGALGPIGDVDEAEWSRLLATNVTGVLLSMKAEIAQMRRDGGGVIVNVASNLGAHMRLSGMGAYIATKAAVSALTRTAALDHIGEGIRINAVSPGPSDTAMSLWPGETADERDARMRDALPAGRVASLDEIAAAIRYLASPESAFAVGTDLVIDGGAAA
jgi:NAD(P)-dependent dehydrogenase (short-subunit alcohol dehydrogenase family)